MSEISGVGSEAKSLVQEAARESSMTKPGKIVTVRPPCQIESGDLGVRGSQARFTKMDFREGSFPEGKLVT